MDRWLTIQSPPRGAVVGGGIAGLTCARVVSVRGFDPVVFEADDHLGGRCSSLSTRIGVVDDGAQCISEASCLAAHAVQPPGELATLHRWTVAATPAGKDRDATNWKRDEDEADGTRTLKLMGAVGMPSMLAMAEALAWPLDVRLNTPIGQARRRGARWFLSGSAGEIEEDLQVLALVILAPLLNFRAHAGRSVTPNYLCAHAPLQALRAHLHSFRADEIDHRVDAAALFDRHAGPASPTLRLWIWAVGAGSRGAVKISRWV